METYLQRLAKKREPERPVTVLPVLSAREGGHGESCGCGEAGCGGEGDGCC